MVRKAIRIALLVCLGLVAVVVFWILPGRNAEIHLSTKAPTNSKRATLKTAPFFLQTDPRWASEKVGGSGESLGAVGCTLCCLSMALAEHGIDLNPSHLNAALKDKNGYTFRGWIKWGAIETITKGTVKVNVLKHPTYNAIDSALANGNPCMVKVLLSSGAQHWVLIVGRDGADYLIKDPLGDGKNTEPLASLAKEFVAVRLVEHTQAQN